MRTRNPIENELDAIRLRIYEETKWMTSEELSNYYRKSGEAAARKYGLKRVPGANLQASTKSP